MIGTRGRTSPPLRLAAATARDFGVPVFYGFRCERCGAGLHDDAGRPRWDIAWPFALVCAGGCAWRRYTRRG